MNQKELDEIIDMFLRVHKNPVIVYAKDFDAYDRHSCEFQKKGMAVVRDEGYMPILICYFDPMVHPSQFGIVTEAKL